MNEEQEFLPFDLNWCKDSKILTSRLQMYKLDLAQPVQQTKPEYHELCHKNWDVKRDH